MNGIRIGLILTLAVALVPVARAKNEYLLAAGLTYPEITNTPLYNCSLCHSSGDHRNPFGMDFEANGHNFQTIEDEDSDIDGFSNIKEIESLTWPGNPLSFPIVFGELTVKKPKSGDTWTVGTKARVTWTSTGEVGSDVSIELWQNGQKVAKLKGSTPNDGKQKIKLKSGKVAAGTGFTIRITSVADPSISDESSAALTIVAAP
jgi:hypothetical protein